MILVLGSGSYIGRIFCAELRRRGRDYALPSPHDYSDFHALFDCIRKSKPEFLVNAASDSSLDPDTGEPARDEILRVNTILPRLIAQVCLLTNTPWGHVSSSEIYSGAKIVVATGVVVAKKIARAKLLRLIAECPEKLRGFTEADEPNFSFRAAPCNFFSGTVALAEEAIRGIGRNYIWRLGLPFNERDEPGNFLRLVRNAEKLPNGVNLLSHSDEFVRACLDLWERDAPFGIYNLGNPGIMTTHQLAQMVRQILNPPRPFELLPEDTEDVYHGFGIPRSHCLLDVSKLLATGVAMRSVSEAVEDSLRRWHSSHDDAQMHRAAA